MARKIKKAYTRTRVKTEIDPERKTKAVQSERHNSDINNIVAKAHKTGQLPVLVNRKPIPSLPEAATYQQMLDKVVQANQAFERLPSEVRANFGNDPRNMLMAIEQADGNEELTKQLQQIGLLEQPALDPPPDDPPADPPPADPPPAK